jgi:uncharacterized protein YjbI with pentapeptide repeats
LFTNFGEYTFHALRCIRARERAGAWDHYSEGLTQPVQGCYVIMSSMTRLRALIGVAFRAAVANKTLSIATALGLALVAYGIWLDWEWKAIIGWKALEGYINPDPDDTTGKKDAVQVYAVIVAGIIASITAAVGLANLRLTRKNLEQQRELEAQRAEQQRELAQGTALQGYYEQIGNLITEYDLRNTDREERRELARGQTLTVLQEVDGNGKGSLLTFIYGAGLIGTENPAVALTGADLQEANLQGAYLRGANLQGANLRGAFLHRADLQEAILQRADLRGADLQEAILQRADLRDANLQGADLQRANLRGTYLQQAFLQGANLRGADLRDANLQGANLQGANLQGAYLQQAFFQGAYLQQAFLQQADLQGADLRGAYLQQADLHRADLQGANLQGAYLRGALHLTQEQIEWTIGSDETLLTEGLHPPELWSKSIEEQAQLAQEYLKGAD